MSTRADDAERNRRLNALIEDMHSLLQKHHLTPDSASLFIREGRQRTLIDATKAEGGLLWEASTHVQPSTLPLSELWAKP